MKDYIIRAINEKKDVKIQVAITTELVEKARKIHNLTKTSSAALGRALTAAAIMAEDMKNEKDSLTINIKGDGPLGRIVVTAKNDGKVKGYVDNPQCDLNIRKKDNKIDVSGAVGKGVITIVKDLGLKEPYNGTSPIVSGEIAEDLAYYFATSEQVPSVVALGVLVDKDLTIKCSGGFIIQLMPGADEETITKIENNISSLPSITEMINNGLNAEDIMNEAMQGFNMKILNKREIEFDCDCSREKLEDALISLGKDELEDMMKKDKGAEAKCHFCNSVYNFDESDLSDMLEKIKHN